MLSIANVAVESELSWLRKPTLYGSYNVGQSPRTGYYRPPPILYPVVSAGDLHPRPSASRAESMVRMIPFPPLFRHLPRRQRSPIEHRGSHSEGRRSSSISSLSASTLPTSSSCTVSCLRIPLRRYRNYRRIQTRIPANNSIRSHGLGSPEVACSDAWVLVYRSQSG